MPKVIIRRRSIALSLTGAYALFAILAIKSAIHASEGKVHTGTPIITTIAYVFCAYFFIDLQRRSSNIPEKTMAWTSAGVFVVRLVPLMHLAFPRFQPHVVAASYSAAALTVAATIALVMRAFQLLGRSYNDELK